MKVKHLIAQLQKLPPNRTVLIWDGWEGEYMQKIHVRERSAQRSKFPKSPNIPNGHVGEWRDYQPYVDIEYIEKRKIVEIFTTDHNGKKLSGLR